ncbi:MAG: acyl-CoA dehydrogenase family protein [Lutimaribacter sp.]
MTSLLETEDETMLRDAARGFLADAAPVANLRANRDQGRPFDTGLWREMAQMGWAGVLVPEAQGGADMGHRAAGILAEEMGRTLAASPFISSAVMAATTLRAAASQQAEQALTAITEGRLIYAVALDEGRKHAPLNTALVAQRAGNGFRLTGTKAFVADGGSAQRVLVLARTAGSAGEAAGLTLFDIHADRAGLHKMARATVDSHDHAQMVFDGVEATGDEVLGTLDDGWALLARGVQAGQAAVAAELLGVAGGAYGMTVGYLKERKQFDRTIGSFQALQHRAAHLWAEIEVTASAIANAGRVLDATPTQAGLAVSLAKARAAQTVDLAVREGVQMHGGIGMTDAYDIGFYMKRARVGSEWLGDYGYHAAQVAAARGF